MKRILLSKMGLDYHNVGVKIIARTLRDAGMEVIYTGLFQSPEQVVETAVQEDVGLIGVSILSGAHAVLVPKMMGLLKEEGLGHIPVVVGGIIPDEDKEKLERVGVRAIFGPGTSLDEILDCVRKLAGNGRKK